MNDDRAQLAALSRLPSIDWGCDVVVVDLETTDLDPARGAITEIAVIRCDRHFRPRPDGTLYLRVDVPSGALVSDWSREYTAWGRSTPGDWIQRGSRPLQTALNQCGPLLAGAQLVAHHVPFDSAWLERAYASASPDTPGRDWVASGVWRRDAIDTRQLASSLAARCVLESRSLAACCRHFSIPLDHHHALSDARACLALARIFLSDHA